MLHERRTITATMSPLVEATILSTRSLMRAASRSMPAAPAVTAGSGMARLGAWIFVAQDDSTLLAAIGDDGTITALRLFNPIGEADRFLDALANKKLKPDMEAIAIVDVPAGLASRIGAPSLAGEAVLVFGSGSLGERRDHIALVLPGTPLERSAVMTVYAPNLYERMRKERGLVSDGQLNLEGAVVVDAGRTLRLFNRGNSGENGITASVDLDVNSVLEYLVRAKANPAAIFDAPISNAIRYDLGLSQRGFPVSITDATVIPATLPCAPADVSGEILLVTAVAEETTDATLDGATSNTIVGVLMIDNESMLIAPLMMGAVPSSLKVEGLAVRDAAWVAGIDRRELRARLAGITDPDATDVNTASMLVEMELVYRPAG